jgi:hypothetical protein
VSPLWRDEIGIHLSPSRVCMVRLRRGLRPALVARDELTISLPDPKQELGVGWSAALAAIDELLANATWRKAALRVVVADCWVRYAIVPWAADLTSSRERLGHGRRLIESIYGEAVRGWETRLSCAPPETARVACSIPCELLAQILALSFKHSARICSLQPQLIVAYENWRHRLPAVGSWFVTVGDGTLAAARLGKDCWDRVYSVRIGPDWTRELKRLQTFGRLSARTAGDSKVFVDAPQAWQEVAGPDGQDLVWLQDDSAALTTLRRLAWVRRLAA